MASSPVDALLQAYVAGRARASEVVAAVAAACFADGGRARDRLRPLLDVIERAAPGVVELAGRLGGNGGGGAGGGGKSPGFEIRPGERLFPPQQEDALRRAAAQVLAQGLTSGGAAVRAGAWARLVGSLRRLFSASA